MTTLFLALLGAVAGTGLVLAAAGAGWIPVSSNRPTSRASTPADNARRRRTIVVAAATGLVAFVVTRWPMSVPLGLLAVLGSGGLRGSGAAVTIAKLEAIASFTEMLRDTLSGAAGLSQALIATAPISPVVLRPALSDLATRLTTGVPLVTGLGILAADLGDPAGDVVVSCLVLAATERAQRLSELLGALAQATREEVTMRLGIEAARASARTAVRMITGFSFGLLALMALFARSYLSPYRTLGGQLVLCVVGCIYGLGLWLMSAMSRPESFARLTLAQAGAQ